MGLKRLTQRWPRWARSSTRVAGVAAILMGIARGGLELALRAVPADAESQRTPTAAVWLEDRDGTPLAAFVSDSDEWYMPLRYEQISPHLIAALVAVEDRRFLEHQGVDWRAAATAAGQNVVARRIVRGASTLSMQVVRLREPRLRSWGSKAGQAFAAMQLELATTKQAIITEYVNRAPFGGNLVGAGAASWRYFGKPCAELSLGQAALLAGLPQSPNRFRPDRSVALASIRRDYVLDRMLAAGMITERDGDQAKREPLDVRWRPLPQYAEGKDNPAIPTLTWLAGMRSQRTARTTLAAPMQRQVVALAREQLDKLRPSGVTSAAVVVVDVAAGECRVAASFSDESPDVDLTRAARSTGSVLKPFIYAAAFESGRYGRTSLVSDSPQSWAGYVPNNYDKAFRGTLSAGEALAESRNIPAMTLLASVGVERTTGIMESFGLRTLARGGKQYGLSLAIGGADATPWEVAEAYATLARLGVHREIAVWRDGIAPREPVGLLTRAACLDVLTSLSDPARTRLVAPEATRLLPAWKTGTSSGHRDAWCAAATPRYAVVVWMGNPTGRGTTALVGAEAAAPLALRILAAIDGGRETWGLPTGETVASNRATKTARLAVVTPPPDQEIILRPEEDAARQRVPLTASGGNGVRRWWFVDGAMSGQNGAGETQWWTPTAGVHEIRVVDDEGHASIVRVSVR